MIITMSKAEMRAMCSIPPRAATRGAVRYIQIKATAAGQVTIMATDSHRALVYTALGDMVDVPAADAVWYILPAQLRALAITHDRRQYLLDTANIPQMGAMQYPDIARVIPDPGGVAMIRCRGDHLQFVGAYGLDISYLRVWQELTSHMDTWLTCHGGSPEEPLRGDAVCANYTAVYVVTPILSRPEMRRDIDDAIAAYRQAMPAPAPAQEARNE